MYRIAMHRRLTHRYVGTFQHLDEHRYVGTALLTHGRTTEVGNNYDEGNSFIRWARLDAGVARTRKGRDDAAKALCDSLSRWGCSHEYDCCGCASYATSVVRRKGRDVVLRTTVSYNY